MRDSSSDITLKDRAFLRKLKVASVPHWRKAISLLMMTMAVVLLLLHLIAFVAGMTSQIFTSWRFSFAIITFLGGIIELQEARYQRIIKYLLESGNGGGANPGNGYHPEQSKDKC